MPCNPGTAKPCCQAGLLTLLHMEQRGCTDWVPVCHPGNCATPLGVTLSPPSPFKTIQVAEFPTSGLIFRDTVKIIELNDDKGEMAVQTFPAMPTV